ncbi:MAG: hypothetical protein FJW39_30605 [Acidobacteria bacterium]|nr:hypothetical protein [Acidobacteriota bacterium]
MDGTCWLCGAKLSLLQRLQGQGFCSPQHRADFQREQEQMALARLRQTASELGKPTVKARTQTRAALVGAPPEPLEPPPQELAAEPPARPASVAVPEREIEPEAPGFFTNHFARGEFLFRVTAEDPVEWGGVPEPPAVVFLPARRGPLGTQQALTVLGIQGDIWTILVSRVAPHPVRAGIVLRTSGAAVQGYDWQGADGRYNSAPEPGLVQLRAINVRVYELWPRFPDPDPACPGAGDAELPDAQLGVLAPLEIRAWEQQIAVSWSFTPAQWTGSVRQGPVLAGSIPASPVLPRAAGIADAAPNRSGAAQGEAVSGRIAVRSPLAGELPSGSSVSLPEYKGSGWSATELTAGKRLVAVAVPEPPDGPRTLAQAPAAVPCPPAASGPIARSSGTFPRAARDLASAPRVPIRGLTPRLREPQPSRLFESPLMSPPAPRMSATHIGVITARQPQGARVIRFELHQDAAAMPAAALSPAAEWHAGAGGAAVFSSHGLSGLLGGTPKPQPRMRIPVAIKPVVTQPFLEPLSCPFGGDVYGAR